MAKNKFVDYNEIVLCRDEFGDNLWNVVGQQLSILTKAGNICVVYDDDVDIIVIQYEHDDTHIFGDSMGAWGVCNPVWLTCEEIEKVESERLSSEESSDNNDRVDY